MSLTWPEPGSTGWNTLVESNVQSVKNTSDSHDASTSAHGIADTSKLALTGAAFYDISTYAGVDNTGVTECAGAINTALADIASKGGRAYAKGTFKIGSTVTLLSSVDLGDAVFNFTSASGTAIQVGSASTNVTWETFVLPQVIQTMKSGTGWAGVAGSVGYYCVNLNSCFVTLTRARSFETSALIYGKGIGLAYNTFMVGHLDNGKINMKLDADATGWTNENLFLGGRYSFDPGFDTTGTRHIAMAVTPHPINNNVFIKPSLERASEYRLEIAGWYNSIYWGRYESTPVNVHWLSNAKSNLLYRGYNLSSVVETTDAGALYNEVDSDQWSRRWSPAPAGPQTFENASSSYAPIQTFMAAGSLGAGTPPATGYAVQLGAVYGNFKRSTDAYPRIQLNAFSGLILLGNGTAAPVAGFSADTTNIYALSNLGFGTSNTYDLGSPGSLPRYVRAGTAVQTGSGATASRPPASTAGVGAMWFDTTLGKPIWSTGSAWVDATGTAV